MTGLVGIDTHVHIHDRRARAGLPDSDPIAVDARSRVFKRKHVDVPVESQAELYRSLNMMAVLVNVTDESNTGVAPIPNDFVADTVAAHPDVFLGMGAIDPWQGELARREIRRIKALGLHGIGELNPGRQQFSPNDRRFYPLWEEAEAQQLPILFHGGYAAAGAGTPGGGGIKLKYCEPMLLDEVAADFPDLTIICAHPAWPWTAQSLAIARHKGNFYIDLSGWAPKYFPAELVQQVDSMISDKALFGSDGPSLPVERWLKEFAELNLKDEVREKVLLRNAEKVFQLGS